MTDRIDDPATSGDANPPDAWAGESDWGQAAPLFNGRDHEFERDWLAENAGPAPAMTPPVPAKAPPQAVERRSRPAPGRAAVSASPGRGRRRPEPDDVHDDDGYDQRYDPRSVVDDDDEEDFPPRKRGRAFLGFLLVLVVAPL